MSTLSSTMTDLIWPEMDTLLQMIKIVGVAFCIACPLPYD